MLIDSLLQWNFLSGNPYVLLSNSSRPQQWQTALKKHKAQHFWRRQKETAEQIEKALRKLQKDTTASQVLTTLRHHRMWCWAARPGISSSMSTGHPIALAGWWSHTASLPDSSLTHQALDHTHCITVRCSDLLLLFMAAELGSFRLKLKMIDMQNYIWFPILCSTSHVKAPLWFSESHLFHLLPWQSNFQWETSRSEAAAQT